MGWTADWRSDVLQSSPDGLPDGVRRIDATGPDLRERLLHECGGLKRKTDIAAEGSRIDWITANRGSGKS